MDRAQTLYALRWMEAFRKLEPRNNITMVLPNFDRYYELEHVVEMEVYSRFLIVRCQPPGAVSCRALVYPGTITKPGAGARDS